MWHILIGIKNMNYCNFVHQSGKMVFNQIENEKILLLAVYGDGGRSSEELSRHKIVLQNQGFLFNHYKTYINYFYHNFNSVGMGPLITKIVNQGLKEVDYFIIIDIDIAPLQSSFIHDVYNKIKDKRTLFGGAQQSNHIFVNDSKHHLYASLSFFAISSKLYMDLSCPSFDYNQRGDVAEEIAWRVEERGYDLCLVFPSHFYYTTEEEQKRVGVPAYWDLGNGHKFGLGTTYGNYVFHATMQNLPRSTELFVQKCKELLT